MTSAQNSKYWRRWSVIATALHWRMIKGRLHPEADATRHSSPQHAAVWSAAERRAAQRACAVTADDLRHGCHVVALQRDKSHGDFTNRDFDALLNLWGDERTITGLLLEPLDLAGEINTANPALKIRERQLHWLRTQCLGGYAMTESERMFGTKNWEALPAADLERLHDHLRARPNALRKTFTEANEENEVEAAAGVPADNIPF